MNKNDDAVSARPQFYKRADSLFDNEAGSDVSFLVGMEPDTWRLPGHRKILADANPVFHAMLYGPMASNNSTLVIDDVDGRAFDNLLRFLYKEEVQIQSVATALTSLYAAHKYLCPGLVQLCVKFLGSNLDQTCVLEVFQHLRLYCNTEKPYLTGDKGSQTEDHIWAPSAPPEEDVFGSPEAKYKHETLSKAFSNAKVKDDKFVVNSHVNMSCLCAELLDNCLQYIDKNADAVLAQEQVEDLDLDGLRMLAERDTLGISSEAILFDAFFRWSDRECKRRKLELSRENRLLVLCNSHYLVRYLCMNSEEFVAGPVQSGLLNTEEQSSLLSNILKHKHRPKLPRHLQDILPILQKPRTKVGAKSAEGTNTISAINTSKSPTKCKSKFGKKFKSKKEEQKKKKNEGKEQRKEKCSFCDVCFSVLSCIFD